MSSPGVTVYIVDDDEAIRDSLRWLLEAKGFVVETYPSAEQFLMDYRWDYPGCLILDVRMPGISGLELYEKLSALNYCLPVVFITGHGDVPMAVNAVKMGAVDFIEKPFKDQELVDLIQRCLRLDTQCRSRVHKSVAIRACLAQLTPRVGYLRTIERGTVRIETSLVLVAQNFASRALSILVRESGF